MAEGPGAGEGLGSGVRPTAAGAQAPESVAQPAAAGTGQATAALAQHPPAQEPLLQQDGTAQPAAVAVAGAGGGADDAPPHGGKERPKLQRPKDNLPCPRCASVDTAFRFWNNYNANQPRYFCRACQRYWTAGGALRDVPVGAGRRKSKSARAAAAPPHGQEATSRRGPAPPAPEGEAAPHADALAQLALPTAGLQHLGLPGMLPHSQPFVDPATAFAMAHLGFAPPQLLPAMGPGAMAAAPAGQLGGTPLPLAPAALPGPPGSFMALGAAGGSAQAPAAPSTAPADKQASEGEGDAGQPAKRARTEGDVTAPAVDDGAAAAAATAPAAAAQQPQQAPRQPQGPPGPPSSSSGLSSGPGFAMTGPLPPEWLHMAAATPQAAQLHAVAAGLGHPYAGVWPAYGGYTPPGTWPGVALPAAALQPAFAGAQLPADSAGLAAHSGGMPQPAAVPGSMPLPSMPPQPVAWPPAPVPGPPLATGGMATPWGQLLAGPAGVWGGGMMPALAAAPVVPPAWGAMHLPAGPATVAANLLMAPHGLQLPAAPTSLLGSVLSAGALHGAFNAAPPNAANA